MKRVKGFDPWWKTKKVIVPVVIIAIVLAVIVVKNRQKPSGTAKARQTVAYCDLARQVDEVATTTGAASSAGNYDGPPEAFAAFVQQVEPTLNLMRSSAPSEIRTDVGTVVDGLTKAQAGDQAAVQSAEFTEAAQKTAEYRSRSCPEGSTSGEG